MGFLHHDFVLRIAEIRLMRPGHGEIRIINDESRRIFLVRACGVIQKSQQLGFASGAGCRYSYALVFPAENAHASGLDDKHRSFAALGIVLPCPGMRRGIGDRQRADHVDDENVARTFRADFRKQERFGDCSGRRPGILPKIRAAAQA